MTEHSRHLLHALTALAQIMDSGREQEDLWEQFVLSIVV